MSKLIGQKIPGIPMNRFRPRSTSSMTRETGTTLIVTLILLLLASLMALYAVLGLVFYFA